MNIFETRIITNKIEFKSNNFFFFFLMKEIMVIDS